MNEARRIAVNIAKLPEIMLAGSDVRFWGNSGHSLTLIKLKGVAHELSSITGLSLKPELKRREVKKQCARRRGSAHFQLPAVQLHEQLMLERWRRD
jgi:hypothetical protein